MSCTHPGTTAVLGYTLMTPEMLHGHMKMTIAAFEMTHMC